MNPVLRASDGRRDRCTAAIALALFVLAEALAFVHACCTEHRFCPEHGAIEDVACPADEVLEGERRTAEHGESIVPGDTQPDSHDACVLIAKKHASTVAFRAPPLVVRALDFRAVIPRAPAAAPALARRYLLAPKQSPPAA